MSMVKKGVARQLSDVHKNPIRVKSARQTGVNKNGPIYTPCSGTLWELDGYETFIPDGYVPVYKHQIDKWFYTKEGGPEDPFRQLGFTRADDIPF